MFALGWKTRNQELQVRNRELTSAPQEGIYLSDLHGHAPPLAVSFFCLMLAEGAQKIRQERRRGGGLILLPGRHTHLFGARAQVLLDHNH